MRVMRLFRIVVLIALALAAAGCGAKDRPAAEGGAEIVSASVPVYVAIDSNLSSEQWQQVDDLLRKFPAYSDALQSLRSELKTETGLEYERDVKPALGDEIDLVWLDFQNDGTNVVALTKPKDEDAFRRMVEKGNETEGSELICEEQSGWQVCSDSQAKLDRFEGLPEGEKLADDEHFNDALAELPEDSLVHVYVRGQSVVEALKDLDVAGDLIPLGGEQGLDYLSAALAAEGGGFRLVGTGRAAKAPEEAQYEPFESKLLNAVPEDAVAFLAFKGGDAYAEQQSELEKNEMYRMGLRELERMLGMPLSSLLEIFENEVALYVRPGSPIPEVTLLIEAPNEQEALQKVNTAVRALTKSMPAQPCDAPEMEGGVEVTCVGFPEFELRTAAFDQMVVVTIGQGAIAKLRDDGDKLADDEGFNDAKDAAGMPDESIGFMWLDLEDGLPMILGLATASGESIPAEIRENLEPLGSFLAWAESDGAAGSFTAFLEID